MNQIEFLAYSRGGPASEGGGHIGIFLKPFGIFRMTLPAV